MRRTVPRDKKSREELLSQLLTATPEELKAFLSNANDAPLPTAKNICTIRTLGGKFILTMMNFNGGFIEELKYGVKPVHRQYNPSTKEWIIDKSYLPWIKVKAEAFFEEVRVLEPSGPSKYDTAYGVLGLTQDCTEAQIKSAHRKLCIIHHPDRGGSHELFLRIQQAYETLKDPKRRKRYDAAMKLTTRR